MEKLFFSREALEKHFDIVVKQCLLELPPFFLDLVEYGPGNTEISELIVRLQYVRYNDKRLNIKEQCDILLKCDVRNLDSRALRALSENHAISIEVVNELSLKALSAKEAETIKQEEELRVQRMWDVGNVFLESFPELKQQTEVHWDRGTDYEWVARWRLLATNRIPLSKLSCELIKYTIYDIFSKQRVLNSFSQS